MAGLSPIGNNWEEISSNLKNYQSGVVYMSDWDKYDGLDTRLGGTVKNFEKPAHMGRKATRSMGRVALMATVATEQALEHAGLEKEQLQDGMTGVAYGSSTGSTDATAEFLNMLANNSTKGLNANTYIKMMAHTTAVNIGVYFGLKGRVYTTSSACTSGSQAIGYAYEAIREGKQNIMIAGGGEELCPTEAAVFDTLFATSTLNDTPELTPKPFDTDRDGLVIGEGACTLVLEELEHALARGAHIHAEIIGFGTNSDGTHVTQPNSETMQIAMELALKNAELPASSISYVNAHGTATGRGDVAETQATSRVFGPNMAISSFKSYTGHTLGACGALEAMTAIHCMNEGWIYPTINLKNIDPECGELSYIKDTTMPLDAEHIMTNNFAFGGINTSIILKRWS
jgi:3-oxoacyl-[acyl-carrier-protein] synthase II